MLKILVTNRQNGKTQNYQFTQNAILVGRQQNCDITLASTKVSRRHAKFNIIGNQIEIEDLGSGNGTLVNNQKLDSNDKIQLKEGDKIQIEEFELNINFSEFKTKTTPKPPHETESKISVGDSTDPEIIEIKMIKKVLGAMDQEKLPHIVVVDKNFENARAVFEEGMDELVVGRDESCDLTINSNVVSRRHAVITVKWGDYVLKDKNSKNSTYVNGEKITEKSIKEGDEIMFGTIKAIFRNPQEFDLKAFTKSLDVDKEKKKFDQTSSFSKKEIIEPEEKVSAAAKISADLGGDKTNEDKKEEKSEKPKEEEEKKETKKEKKEKKEVEEILKDTEKKDSPKAEPLTKKPKSLTATEIILFGFGAVVIIAVIAVLVLLLQ